MRLVALGDSTVEGLEDPGEDGAYRGWADRLAEHLDAENPGLRYANLAVRGQTATQVRATQLEPALALRPDLAVVVAGMNDLLRPRLDVPRLRDDILAMHAALRCAGARVVSFTMPDMARVAPVATLLRRRLAALNAIVEEAGREHGTLVVDFAAEPVAGDPGLWHDDRLHANPEGHRRIALALAEALGLRVGDWRAPVQGNAAAGRVRMVAGEVAWARRHLLPWAWRHLHGRSSGDGQACKRPALAPLRSPLG